MPRRCLLIATLLFSVVVWPRTALPQPNPKLALDELRRAPASVVGATAGVKVERTWTDGVCRSRLVNEGSGDETPRTLSFSLAAPCRVTEFWNGAALGRHAGRFEVKDLPPHSARLLVCEPEAR